MIHQIFQDHLDFQVQTEYISYKEIWSNQNSVQLAKLSSHLYINEICHKKHLKGLLWNNLESKLKLASN